PRKHTIRRTNLRRALSCQSGSGLQRSHASPKVMAPARSYEKMSPSLGFFPRATSAGVLTFAVAQAALAQTPDRTTLPIAPPPFRGNVTRDYRTSTLEPAEPLTAPKG